MGWYGLTSYELFYKPNGKDIDRKKTMDNYMGKEVVYSSMVNSVYYAAMKGSGNEIYGLVCLTTITDGHFSYKPITEDMGPHYYNCPNTVLRRLTPTTNNWALEWREKCKANNQFKRKLNRHPAKIYFTCPFDIPGSYSKGQTILLHYHEIIVPYKNRWKGYYTDGTYRFPGKYLTIDTVNFVD